MEREEAGLGQRTKTWANVRVERTPRRTQTSVSGGGGKDESIFRKRDLG